MDLSFWVGKLDLCEFNLLSIKEIFGHEISEYRKNSEIKKFKMTSVLCLHVVCVEGLREGTERQGGGREEKRGRKGG